jgi:hypothetical protein
MFELTLEKAKLIVNAIDENLLNSSLGLKVLRYLKVSKKFTHSSKKCDFSS